MNAGKELRALSSEYLDGSKQSSNVYGFSFMELVRCGRSVQISSKVCVLWVLSLTMWPRPASNFFNIFWFQSRCPANSDSLNLYCSILDTVDYTAW